MKKIALFRNVNGSPELVDRFDTKKEASDCVASIVDGEDDVTVFDFTTEEQEYTDICERVKSYADACHVLGISDNEAPEVIADGGLMRPDEIARRKLETITAALNEGWKPDWNNTDQYKYYPWFYINPGKGKDPDGKPSGAYAGLSYAYTDSAAFVYEYVLRLSALLPRPTFSVLRRKHVYRPLRRHFGGKLLSLTPRWKHRKE